MVTVVGPDRPGIVNRLSDVAQRLGANWAGSRMANLAGQFAGMVHFEVPDDRADALADALGALESPELHVVIARSAAGTAAPATPPRAPGARRPRPPGHRARPLRQPRRSAG